MSEDLYTEPHPHTAAPGGGPSTAQSQTVATSAPTATSALHAPTPTTPFHAPGPPTPPQGHGPTAIEYAPMATPPAIPAPPRAASGHSHPSLRHPSMPGPMRHTIASLEDAATLSGYRGPQGLGGGHPLPALPHEARRPGIDWIVPVEEKPYREKSVGERLQPTLATAMIERDKYAMKARLTGYTLNAAIGMQVLLGSLTTAISAAISGKSAQIATVTLGGLATLVASYLARARGSNEPELSITRVKDLEQFIRECQAFQMDHGHILGDKYDHQLDIFRRRFEELLGNASGERKLSPPV